MMFPDTMDTRYLLGEGDIPLVGCGDTASGGDVIATGSAPPAIVAFAATLHLSADDARDAMVGSEDVVCSVGDVLGSRRSGLIRRKVAAPVRGTVHCLSESGTIVIRNERTAYEYRARYGGIVHAISDMEIVIRSAIMRGEYAFAVNVRDIGPLQIDPGLLDGEFPDGWLPQASASIVVAHIADVARLSSITRSFHDTLFVGSVTESVALAILEHAPRPSSWRTKGAGIVVLSGVGNVAQGKEAVAPFQDFHGAQTLLNRFTQTVTILPPGDSIKANVLAQHMTNLQSAL